MGCRSEGGRSICPECLEGFQSSKSVVADSVLLTLGSYEGLLQRCLSQVKNQGQRALAEELVEYSVAKIKAEWSREPVRGVLGVPSSKQGRRFRGFSFPDLLEAAIAKAMGWPALSADCKAHYPETAKSSRGLSLEERLANIWESSRSAGPQGKPLGTLLVVDDVVTSGATMTRITALAREQGWDPILCFAIAAAPLEVQPLDL